MNYKHLDEKKKAQIDILYFPKFKFKVHHKGVLFLYNKGAHPTKRSSFMNYKHLDEKKKAQIDILYGLKYSMREIGRKLSRKGAPL